MILTVDTGGTKTLVGRFSTAGTLEQSHKFATPLDVDEYINQTVAALRMLAADQPITHLSVALPGVVENGVAVRCINLGWRHVPIKQRLAAHFPEAIINVANDATLAGIASMRSLEPTPTCGLYITIGTGIGTAIISHGRPLDSLNRCEGGHMLVTYGKETDSWEHIASGRALTGIFGDLQTISPGAWTEVAERIAIGLQALIAFAQPDIIIIGGGVAVYFDQFCGELRGSISEKLPSFIACPPIIAAPHPEEMVIYGCYQAIQDDLA